MAHLPQNTVPPQPIPPVTDNIPTLPTGELQIVETKDTAEQQIAKPASQKPTQAPPPSPERALLPTLTYHALYIGRKPASSVDDAIKALELNIPIDNLPSHANPVPGIYSLVRSSRPGQATTLNPTGVEQIIAYQPSLGTRTEEWRVGAFRAHAYDIAQQEISTLKKEKQIIKKQGIRNTLIGAGIGTTAVTLAIAFTWGLKGHVDSGRFFETNHASAQDRITYAHNSYEEVAGKLKTAEEQTAQLQEKVTTLETKLTEVTGKLTSAKFNAESAIQQTDSALASLLDQTALVDNFWTLSDDLEIRQKTATEQATSNLYALHTMQRTLDAWNAIPAHAKEVQDTLQYRFPAYQMAAGLLQKLGKSNADIQKQQVTYLRALKDQTKRELEASIITQLAGNPDPQMLHATVAASAQFAAENTAKPVNPNVTYHGGLIEIKADNCITATATLANVLNISVPIKEKFIAVEQSVCKPNGTDIRTQKDFTGYHWGSK